MEPTKMKAWKIGICCGGVLCLLLLLVSLNELKALFQPGPGIPSATNTITVSGTGDIAAIPNIATFSFGVTETAATVGDAQTAASTKTNAAIKAMTDMGVASTDVQVLSYTINPHYEYSNQPCVYNTNGSNYCPGQKSTLTGYDVSETIQVKVRDLTKAGDLIQAIGSLGVQNVDDLQFSIDNADAVQDQARSLAIVDARANADKLAGELGVHLVRIVSFSDNSGNGIEPVMYSAKAMSASLAAPAPSLPQGQQKVSDTVSVTYEIR